MTEKDLLEKIYKVLRTIVWLSIVSIIILLFGVSKLYSNGDSNSTSSDSEETEFNTEYDVSTFKEIKASDLKKETKGQTRVVYIGRSTCSWCAAFLPRLWEAEKEFDYETLYIDISKILDYSKNPAEIIDQTSYDIINNLETAKGYEDFITKDFGSTPMILIVKDNKLIGGQTGYSDYDTFKKVLTDAGF